jgi:hypothetical protein
MGTSSLTAPSRLAVTYRPLSDLVPDPRNARTHPKRQINQLTASIEEFGFTNPILADPDGHIIAGHGRLRAARELGLTEVPTITLSGLSDVQKRALRIADNKIALNAGWDLEILQQELGELASIDVDIDPTLTGFSTGEIDVIVSASPDPMTNWCRRFRQSQKPSPVTSGFWVSIGWGAVIAAMLPFCSGSSATARESTVPSSIHPTMCGLGGTQWQQEAIASSPWLRER